MPSPPDPEHSHPPDPAPLPQPGRDENLQRQFDAFFGDDVVTAGLGAAGEAFVGLIGWEPENIADLKEFLNGTPKALDAMSNGIGAVAQRIGGSTFEAKIVVRGDVVYRRVLRVKNAMAVYLAEVAAQGTVVAQFGKGAVARLRTYLQNDIQIAIKTNITPPFGYRQRLEVHTCYPQ